MIAVTLVGVTVRKNRRETDSCSIRQEERKMISIPCENSVNYPNVLTTYSKLETSSDVANEAKSYEIVVNKNSIQKITKNWSRRVIKMSRRTNPQVLFDILRPLSMGETYFIQ
jgi:hypothetical protein